MKHTKLGSECDGGVQSVSSLENETFKQQIFKRCGIFEGQDQSLDVCETHLQLLTTKFHDKVFSKGKVCMWPDHGGDSLKKARVSGALAKTMVEITEETSRAAHGLKAPKFLPMGGYLCFEHSVVLTNLIKAEEHSSMDLFGSPASSSGLAAASTPSQPLSQMIPTQDLEEERFKTFNNLLKIHNFKHMEYMNRTPFNEQGRSTQYWLLAQAGRGFLSVLKSMSTAEDYGQIYNAAKRSRVVERLINPLPLLKDTMISEFVLAYNGAQSRQERRSILSFGTSICTYTQMCTMNPDKKVDPDAEFESDTEIEVLVAENEQLVLTPAVTYWAYRQAKMHYLQSKRGLAPVIFAPRHTWKLSEEQFEAIFGK